MALISLAQMKNWIVNVLTLFRLSSPDYHQLDYYLTSGITPRQLKRHLIDFSYFF